jgi:capsular polysaccharide transport system permease protein
MTDNSDNRRSTGLTALERSQLVARALSEAARRARFSTRRRSLTGSGFQARRGQKLMRILRAASFLLIFVIPSIGALIYYGLIASDQYVSEARFTLRGGAAPKADSLGALTGIPSIQIVQDTQIVMNFLQSRTIVEALQSSVDIRRMFSRPEVDYFSRLDPDEPIEKVVRYWKSMSEVSLQMPAGIVVFTVRAFTAEDSARIARAALEASENLVNEMNDRMRQDALAMSLLEQDRAKARLAAARSALEMARNEEGMLSAVQAADAQNALITAERGNLLKMQQEYETQRQYLSELAPQLRALQRRIDAEKDQIAKLQAQLTQTDAQPQPNGVLSGSMTKLDHLELERQLAEKLYASAMSAHERARLIAESKLMYINTFVYPVEAEEARYPKRALIISLAVFGSLAAWGLFWGLAVMARNHMA